MGYDYLGDADRPREARSMQGAGPADCDHGIVPRVTSLFDRHDAHGIFHVVGRNNVYAPGGWSNVQAERRSNSRRDSRFGSVKIKPHGTRIKEVWRDVAEHKVCIGDSRVFAILAVADGARFRARAVRPN